MRLIALTWICFGLVGACFAQTALSMDDFLAEGLKNYQPSTTAPAETPPIPWVDKLEFRTETRDFEFDQQEYLVRLTPVAGKIRRAQADLYQHWTQEPDQARQKAQQTRSYVLHRDWLLLYLLQERTQLLDSLQLILNDRQFLLDQQLSNLTYSASDLLKLEKQRSDQQWEQAQLELTRQRLLDQYQLKDRTLLFGAFPSPTAIEEWLQQDHAVLPSEEYAYERSLLEKEIALEIAERQQWLDFVQVRYQGPHEDLLTERLAVGVGFILPTKGSRQLKIEKLQLEQAQKEQAAELEQQLQTDALQQCLATLSQQLAAFRSLTRITQAENAQLQRLSQALSQDEGVNPDLLLDIRQRQLEQQLQLLEQRQRLLRAYLDVRQARGDFWAEPGVNVWRGI